LNYIDLRSDTVTLPTEEMLHAMKESELGDDILGEDPTVQKLEKMGAEIFGKEAALFTVSGTMSNQIAVMVYTERGDEIIAGKESHMYNLEVGALSALSQVQVKPISCPGGFLNPAVLESEIRLSDIQTAKTSLVCIENPYNLNKGHIMDLDNISQIRGICSNYHIPIYMDGARIFNAAAALKKNVKEIVKDADAVQTCLTKGLSAPVGSLLAGTKEFIEEARRMRQRLGGGMRQAGVIAAAGIVSLEKMVNRLPEDHEKTRVLFLGIKALDERLIEESDVDINIISLNLEPLKINGDKFLQKLNEHQIKIKKIGQSQFRMVIHRHITYEHINKVLHCFKELLNNRQELI
jgi:threonine aldolase